jgi:hypothetical protein
MATLKADWQALLDGGTYTQEGDSITLALDGEAVKAFVMKALRALYAGSTEASAMLNSLLGMHGAVLTDEDWAEAESELPPLPVTVTVNMEDGVAVSATATLTVTDDNAVVAFNAHWYLTADGGEMLTLTGRIDGQELFKVELNAAPAADGAYTGRISAQMAGVMIYDIAVTATPDGGLDAELDAQVMDGFSLVSFNVTASGTAVEAGGVVIQDFPEMRISASEDGQEIGAVTLALNQTLTELDAPIAPSRSFTSLYTLDSDGLQAWVDQIEASIMNFLAGIIPGDLDALY